MSGLNNLKSDRVVRTFERLGWAHRGQSGSHVKMTKPGSPFILSIPVHRGKPIKQGLIRDLIAKAGLTPESFLKLY